MVSPPSRPKMKAWRPSANRRRKGGTGRPGRRAGVSAFAGGIDRGDLAGGPLDDRPPRSPVPQLRASAQPAMKKERTAMTSKRTVDPSEGILSAVYRPSSVPASVKKRSHGGMAVPAGNKMVDTSLPPVCFEIRR